MKSHKMRIVSCVLSSAVLLSLSVVVFATSDIPDPTIENVINSDFEPYHIEKWDMSNFSAKPELQGKTWDEAITMYYPGKTSQDLKDLLRSQPSLEAANLVIDQYVEPMIGTEVGIRVDDRLAEEIASTPSIVDPYILYFVEP